MIGFDFGIFSSRLTLHCRKVLGGGILDSLGAAIVEMSDSSVGCRVLAIFRFRDQIPTRKLGPRFVIDVSKCDRSVVRCPDSLSVLLEESAG